MHGSFVARNRSGRGTRAVISWRFIGPIVSRRFIGSFVSRWLIGSIVPATIRWVVDEKLFEVSNFGIGTPRGSQFVAVARPGRIVTIAFASAEGSIVSSDKPRAGPHVSVGSRADIAPTNASPVGAVGFRASPHISVGSRADAVARNTIGRSAVERDRAGDGLAASLAFDRRHSFDISLRFAHERLSASIGRATVANRAAIANRATVAWFRPFGRVDPGFFARAASVG